MGSAVFFSGFGVCLVFGFGSVLVWSLELGSRFWGFGTLEGGLSLDKIFFGRNSNWDFTLSSAAEMDGSILFSGRCRLKRKLSVALVNVVKHILSHLLYSFYRFFIFVVLVSRLSGLVCSNSQFPPEFRSFPTRVLLVFWGLLGSAHFHLFVLLCAYVYAIFFLYFYLFF